MNEAHARITDPATSHAAAASVGELLPRQRAVLDAFKSCEPDHLTDEELIERYRALESDYAWPRQADSGLRSRRHELVIRGLIADSGAKAKTKSGRHTIIWRLA